MSLILERDLVIHCTMRGRVISLDRALKAAYDGCWHSPTRPSYKRRRRPHLCQSRTFPLENSRQRVTVSIPILLDQISAAVQVVDSAWKSEYIENPVEIKVTTI